MGDIITNIDDYVKEIKCTIYFEKHTHLFINTLIEGISSYIATISAFHSEYSRQGWDINKVDLALEKLHTLVTLLEIKSEEIEEEIL